MSDPKVNFSLIVHINILKKPPQISAHKSHVKNEFHAILDIFTIKNIAFFKKFSSYKGTKRAKMSRNGFCLYLTIIYKENVSRYGLPGAF